MMTFEIYKIVVFAVIFCLTMPFISSYSEEFETLQIEIKYLGGDRIDTFQTNYIIYQDSDKTPFIEKSLESNPESITLPKDHRYKVEVFVNGMFAEVGYVELDEPKKLDINIPLSGGLQLNVFFKNGENPIDNATYVIKSNDGQEQARGNTNENGDSLRHWLQSTSRDQDYYVAEV
ncbi:MAG TPA: hypothetical protein VMW74_08025, partial [Nitrosopumilaceae archaeon]|nr:hypothetical protein [Nitrosopumilaceae archaeon]